MNKVKDEYEDSGEFTDEMETLGGLAIEANRIIEQERWTEWVRMSDQNYGVDVTSKNEDLFDAVTAFLKAYDEFEKEISSV